MKSEHLQYVCLHSCIWIWVQVFAIDGPARRLKRLGQGYEVPLKCTVAQVMRHGKKNNIYWLLVIVSY